MIDDLKLRWLELGKIPSSKLTPLQVEEQWNLAQALTFHLNRTLYDNLNAHRAKCLELLRDCTVTGGVFVVGTVTYHVSVGGPRYNIMAPAKPRRIHWREIELTPDITFTFSNELVGKVIPANYTRALKKMIQLQSRLLLTLEDKA